MRRNIIPYDPKLKELARKLRNDATPGEVILWAQLRNKRFYGLDFHRQKPLLNFIADLYCHELNLVIEIDGKYHDHEEQYHDDKIREMQLANYGATIIRFTELEVRQDILNVLRTLEGFLESKGFDLAK